MIRKIFIALAAVAAMLVVWALTRNSAPPRSRFARAERQTLTSTLETNGKVEPLGWASARAERPGVVQQIFIERGQSVTKGAPLVALDGQQAQADLANANARIDDARAAIQLLGGGGRPADLADIDSKLAKARLDLRTARRDYASLKRLEARQAASRKETSDAHEVVQQDEMLIQALEERRAKLVAPSDRQSAAAKLRAAEADAALARRNLDLSTIRAPIGGAVYQFDLRLGSYLNAGDLVANIGKLDPVRVTIYVDEPDLGRVTQDLPVLITWDAMPGRQWRGRVDRTATQVLAMGSRQVGEVGSIVGNPGHDLLPGTNINAEIQSGRAGNALTIPREALRRRGGRTGVFVLVGDRIVWRAVETGITTLTRIEVKRGLSNGDAVALPSDQPLKDGQEVDPVYVP